MCPRWAAAVAPPCTCSGTSPSSSGRLVEFSAGRTFGVVVLLALTPAAVAVPALAALTLVSTVCLLVVGYEVIRYREARFGVRHPDLAG